MVESWCVCAALLGGARRGRRFARGGVDLGEFVDRVDRAVEALGEWGGAEVLEVGGGGGGGLGGGGGGGGN